MNSLHFVNPKSLLSYDDQLNSTYVDVNQQHQQQLQLQKEQQHQQPQPYFINSPPSYYSNNTSRLVTQFPEYLSLPSPKYQESYTPPSISASESHEEYFHHPAFSLPSPSNSTTSSRNNSISSDISLDLPFVEPQTREKKIVKLAKKKQSHKSLTASVPENYPTFVKTDQNGVDWIRFVYSKDKVKTSYKIRCDIDSVDAAKLEEEFKLQNCIYPRACVPPEQYKGNRQKYESECNRIGWCLVYINPILRGQRGLIQRAVDSWRNTNSNPCMHSRRVRRISKIQDMQKSKPEVLATCLDGFSNDSCNNSTRNGNAIPLDGNSADVAYNPQMNMMRVMPFVTQLPSPVYYPMGPMPSFQPTPAPAPAPIQPYSNNSPIEYYFDCTYTLAPYPAVEYSM